MFGALLSIIFYEVLSMDIEGTNALDFFLRFMMNLKNLRILPSGFALLAFV
jgi:hypothetical protein